jgi:hypothetical protein
MWWGVARQGLGYTAVCIDEGNLNSEHELSYTDLLELGMLSQSDYKLHDRDTGILSPAEAKEFSSSICVYSNSEAHPFSYPIGTGGGGGSFPRW